MKFMKPVLVVFVALAFLSSIPAAFASPDGNPPGWSKGKKAGWGDSDMPPGLAKKEGDSKDDKDHGKKHHHKKHHHKHHHHHEDEQKK